jgi:hypothetical protein
MSTTAKFYNFAGECLKIETTRESGKLAQPSKPLIRQARNAAARQGFWQRRFFPENYKKFLELKQLGKASINSI